MCCVIPMQDPNEDGASPHCGCGNHRQLAEPLGLERNGRKSLGPVHQTRSLTKTFPVLCEGHGAEFLASKS